MEGSLEQRYAIKFCVRLGKNATETFQMLQEAFKDDCISRSQSGRWHKAFKEGQEEVVNEPRSGRSTTTRTNATTHRRNAHDTIRTWMHPNNARKLPTQRWCLRIFYGHHSTGNN
ncbi:hypothetical protein NQ318_018047 [Aromia moschata]|uniref:Mos1 transposase HTH domain-containing protein n=1 Tax=Aromia moschata TaxID=1265417 RepID=A0AAV8ZEV6_9CUCU|nr:hypothetical protein NQ318_018047 [Aromia moschata]